MSKFNLSRMVKNLKLTTAKHSPEIFMAVGVAGMIGTTVLAVKATPKAVDICDKLKAEYEEERKDEPTKMDYVKATWKCYLPSALLGVASIACLLNSNSVSMKRNAALATAYQVSTTALKEYKDKVVETIGENKAKEVEKKAQDSAAKKAVEEQPSEKATVIVTGKGSVLFYDPLIDRYFESDTDTIEKAINNLNRQMLSDMYISLNDLYDELDLKHTDIGNDLGWNVNTGLIEASFSAQITDEGRPCIVMTFTDGPLYNYTML